MLVTDDFPKKCVATAVDLSSEGLAGFAWDLDRTLEILENWFYEPTEGKDNHSISIEKAIKAVEAYKYRPIANDVIVDLVISDSQNSSQTKSPFDFLKTHIQK